jgi:hypothetical protein
MKKIYKFYGNVIKTEDVDNLDFREEISDINNGYRSIDIDNIIYRIYNINIDIENETTIFDVKRAFSFSYSIYYPNYNNEIIEELKRLGYSQSSVAGNGKHLFTNAHKALFYFTDSDYNNGGIGYVCNNVLEARDIAAIQNECDINQLFKFPNDEPEQCTCFSHVDEWGDFEDTDYPKKMTPEEIIEYYKTFEIPNFYR